jgi:Protein of unknown function (DUF1552)
MKTRTRTTIARRQFLRGSGISIALPFLPSLFPRRASGVTLVPENQIGFVGLSPYTSAVAPGNFFPADASARNAIRPFTGMTIHEGGLDPRIVDGELRISEVLSAPRDRFSYDLINKINVINGIDIPFYCRYHQSGWLGNYKADYQETAVASPTIDDTMAWSPAFNRGGTLALRSLNFDDGRPVSFGYSVRGNPTSAVTRNPALDPSRESTRALFLKVIGVPPTQLDMDRALVLDRVTARFKSLRESNRRLSADDRRRLDDHVQRLRELEIKLAGPRLSCPAKAPGEDGPAIVGDDASARVKRLQLVNDIIAAAFACGSTRIATVGSTQPLIDHPSYEQDVEQSNHQPSAQLQVVANHKRYFSDVFVDLLTKLNVSRGDGSTILDACIVQWGLSHSHMLHNTISLPLVTAGSAGGRLGTGRYLDYRNRERSVSINSVAIGNPGFHINRWFQTVFNAMGVTAADTAGKGYDQVMPEGHKPYAAAYVAGQHESRTNPLPFFTV